jgi:hypothetical protein
MVLINLTQGKNEKRCNRWDLFRVKELLSLVILRECGIENKV